MCDLDYWIEALAQSCRESYCDPKMVSNSPYNQAVHRVDASRIKDPDHWAMTWRAYVKKRVP